MSSLKNKRKAAKQLAHDAPEHEVEPIIKTSFGFLDGFEPPDYQVYPVLQRSFVYSLTGPTGTGKTAIALEMALRIERGWKIGGHEVERCRVLYFAGENPDDVKIRWIQMLADYELDSNEVEVDFVEGAKALNSEIIRQQIETETKRNGPYGCVIVETSAAFFQGDSENENAQMLAHAKMLRSLVDLVDGKPTVICTCHPVKNPTPDNILPRGGGAFIAEIDGNLVAIAEADNVVKVHWHGKFRGPDFAPLYFRLNKSVTCDNLKDTKGRSIFTVTATPISADKREELLERAAGDQDRVLGLMLARPDLVSIREMCEALGLMTKPKGKRPPKPLKARLHRHVKALQDHKLVQQGRDGHYTLTDKGKKLGEPHAREFRNDD